MIIKNNSLTRWALVIVIMLNTAASLCAQAPEEIYGMFLLTFARNTQWPTTNRNRDFVIGILNAPDVFKNLTDASKAKVVGSQKLLVREFANAQDVSPCNILFIPESETKALGAIAKQYPNEPMLIVSEKKGLASRGSCINFHSVDGKLRFEFNASAIEKRGMKLSSRVKLRGTEVR